MLGSPLRREQYVRMHRLLVRRQARVSPQFTITLLFVVALMLPILLDSPVVGLDAWVLSVAVLLVAVTAGALVWWQPYRLWTANERLLAAPGTVTLDSTGLDRVLPGVLETRIAWSSIEGSIDSGDVLGLSVGRHSWILVPLPEDPEAAAMVRDCVAEHVPPAVFRGRRGVVATGSGDAGAAAS